MTRLYFLDNANQMKNRLILRNQIYPQLNLYNVWKKNLDFLKPFLRSPTFRFSPQTKWLARKWKNENGPLRKYQLKPTNYLIAKKRGMYSFFMNINSKKRNFFYLFRSLTFQISSIFVRFSTRSSIAMDIQLKIAILR